MLTPELSAAVGEKESTTVVAIAPSSAASQEKVPSAGVVVHIIEPVPLVGSNVRLTFWFSQDVGSDSPQESVSLPAVSS